MTRSLSEGKIMKLTRSVHLVFSLSLLALCTTSVATGDELKPTQDQGTENELLSSWFTLEEDQLQLLESSSPQLHRVLIADEWSTRTAFERYRFLSPHLRELWGAEQPDESLNAVRTLGLIEDPDNQKSVAMGLDVTNGQLLHHYLHSERLYEIHQNFVAKMNSHIENQLPMIAQEMNNCMADTVSTGNGCSLESESYFHVALKRCVTDFEGEGLGDIGVQSGVCVSTGEL